MVLWLLAMLSGIALALAFPRPSLDLLIWFCLVPLLLALPGRSLRQAFAFGWVAGAVAHLIAFRWVLAAIARLQSISLLAAAPLFALFIAYHAIQLGLFAVASAFLLKRPDPSASPTPDARGLTSHLSLPLLLAVAWLGLDWLFPRLFPWALALPVVNRLALVQLADVTGIWGLSFVVAFVNAALAVSLLQLRSVADLHRRAMLPLVMAGSLVMAVWSYGTWRLHQLEQVATQPLSLLLVQANLAADGNTSPEQAFAIHRQLTLDAIDGRRGTGDSRSQPGVGKLPDLVVWPESVLPIPLRDHAGMRERVVGLAHQLERPLVLGALDSTPDRQGQYNTLFVVDPSGQFDAYHKQRLLPFGEYAPVSSWRTTAVLTAGEHGQALPVKLPHRPGSISIAPSICFEALFPGTYGRMVESGANVLVNITDDSWLADGDAPYEHLQAAILRAIETRRPLVRVSNSGVSAVVSSSGQVLFQTAFGTVATGQVDVPVSKGLP